MTGSLYAYTKAVLLRLAEDLEIAASVDDSKKKIIQNIMSSIDYDEGVTKQCLDVIVREENERKEILAREKQETEEQLAREDRLIKEQRYFELEKLRLKVKKNPNGSNMVITSSRVNVDNKDSPLREAISYDSLVNKARDDNRIELCKNDQLLKDSGLILPDCTETKKEGLKGISPIEFTRAARIPEELDTGRYFSDDRSTECFKEREMGSSPVALGVQWADSENAQNVELSIEQSPGNGNGISAGIEVDNEGIPGIEGKTLADIRIGRVVIPSPFTYHAPFEKAQDFEATEGEVEKKKEVSLTGTQCWEGNGTQCKLQIDCVGEGKEWLESHVKITHEGDVTKKGITELDIENKVWIDYGTKCMGTVLERGSDRKDRLSILNVQQPRVSEIERELFKETVSCDGLLAKQIDLIKRSTENKFREDRLGYPVSFLDKSKQVQKLNQHIVESIVQLDSEVFVIQEILFMERVRYRKRIR